MILTIPDVMSSDEVKELRALVAVCVFEDGALAAGAQAKRVKKNEQLIPGDPRMLAIQKRVSDALLRSDEFKRATMPKSIRPCLISRYQPGMQYGRHVDNALMGSEVPVRSDIAVTLFLCEPTEYEGGELVIHGTFGQQEVKLPQGWAVIYPASSLHEVAPVTKGQRLCAVTWVESLVRDPARREVLYDLGSALRHLAEKQPDCDEVYILQKSHANLMRMWAET